MLFFDLDGTLIDSALGITRCIAHALERLDHPVPDEAQLRGWIGPALRVSFLPLLQDHDRVEQAVALYLERFDAQGWREHELYEGVGAVVEALHAAGHRLAVVTAKNEPHARRIVRHLPFGHCFEDVVGSTHDGRLTHKPELVAKAIAASSAFSIAGGGDTLAAVDKYGVQDGISYISTGGGAFLEFCEGKVLPAVAALQARSA